MSLGFRRDRPALDHQHRHDHQQRDDDADRPLHQEAEAEAERGEDHELARVDRSCSSVETSAAQIASVMQKVSGRSGSAIRPIEK